MENHLTSIAFPAISTGVYGYPIEAATQAAVRIAREYAAQPSSVAEIIFCCFSSRDFKIYEAALAS